MRPRRIARRVLARIRNWNQPHVHCPACGSDNPLPPPDIEAPCPTCRTPWVLIPRTGDPIEDQRRIEQVAVGRPHVAQHNALVVDVLGEGGVRVHRIDPVLLIHFPEHVPAR